MVNPDLEVVIGHDLEDLSKKAADFVVRSIMERARSAPCVSIALSGGETPKRLYEHLTMEPLQKEIPWNQVHLFWGDERCVQPEDPKSNYRMAHQFLISRVPIPSKNVHRMPTELVDPQQAADQYESTLRTFFGSPPEEWPRFDLVLLGVGSDGHTASLFPGVSALKEKKRWVVSVYIQKLKVHRLTLTLPVFNHAAQIIFLVAGPEKAQILRGLSTRYQKQTPPPFRLIKPHRGKAVFFLDKSAASLLTR